MRQLIPGPVPAVAVIDIGQHLGLHKALDEGGFSGAYRTHHADIDTAAGAGRHILINGCGLIHGPFLLLHNILSGVLLYAPVTLDRRENFAKKLNKLLIISQCLC